MIEFIINKRVCTEASTGRTWRIFAYSSSANTEIQFTVSEESQYKYNIGKKLILTLDETKD